MNKRILSVLLVVALLVAGTVIAAQATVWAPTEDEITQFNKIAETYPTMANVSNGFCPVCGEVEGLVWEELPANGGALTLGKHYYVPAGGRTPSTAYSTGDPGAGNDKKPASTVCIHLNGQNITASGANRIFTVGVRSTLNLIGSGIVTGAATTGSEGSTINSQGYINFFGGTYKHAATTDNSTLRHRRSGTIVNMYNGTTFTADEGVYGTNVELKMGTLNMYGGTIEKGDHTLNINGDTNGHDGIQTFGGNVYVSNDHDTVVATFNMYGGTIKDGKAGKGGNVAVATVAALKANVTFNMIGGEIIDGTAIRSSAATGGNVYMDVRTGNCFFNMTGGTVSGGKVTTDGETITGTGGNFSAISYTATLQARITINQSKGATTLVTGGQANHGGNFYIDKYSYLSIPGGTISDGLAGGADDTVNFGGNVYVYASGNEQTQFYQNGGTISGGKADKGGNVAINAAKAEVVLAGTLTGGRHNTQALGEASGVPMQMGGNLYVAKGLVIVKNGKLLDGFSRNGGNIGIEGTAAATVYLQNATVSGGEARYTGGNIYMMGTSTLDLGRMDKATPDATEKTLITGGTVSGGIATESTGSGYGGNIYVVAGTLNLKKGTVTDGIASQAGGNLNVTGGTVNISGADITDPQENAAAGNSFANNIYQSAGTINHTAGTVSGGKGVNGGNVTVAGVNAVYTLNGGTVEGGKATSRGNNFYLRAGEIQLLGGAINDTVGEAEGSTQTFDGNSLYVGAVAATKKAVVTIGGNMTINTGDGFGDIYINGDATGLVVNGDFTGEVHVSLPTTANRFRPSSNFYGYHIGSEYVKEGATVAFGATGAYTGKLVLKNGGGEPEIYPVANGATEGYTYDLVIASIRGNVMEDDKVVAYNWYPTMAEAVAADDAYIALFDDAEVEIPAGKTVYVNINSHNLAVSGEGELVFFDANTTKGAVSITEGSTATLVNNSNNGKLVSAPNSTATYLTYKNQDGTFSSYKLRVKLKGVSLRPSTAGVYFRGEWDTEISEDQLDDVLGGYGVAVSLTAQPTEDLFNQEGVMWVEYTADDWNGEQKTGVEITGIMKDGKNDNAARGKMPIYAATYITVWNGEEMVTIIDEVDTNGYSLYDVMNLMEDNETVWGAYGAALNSFYNTWAADMATWEFDNIGK